MGAKLDSTFGDPKIRPHPSGPAIQLVAIGCSAIQKLG
jgi:hypothetical protein